jgi:ribosome-associated protein
MTEIEFRFSRSGGPGGQNVNRTASQVELRFDVASSDSLADAQKARIRTALRGHIDSEGIIHLTSQATPSQWRNRQDVLERFQTLLAQALRTRRKRVPTRPTRASQELRLERKKRRGSKKALRRPVRRMDD